MPPMTTVASGLCTSAPRQRTFAVKAMRRLPFSRLIWPGPRAYSTTAIDERGT